MKNKIAKIEMKKEYNGSFIHDIQFENGDIGQAFLKSDCPAEYEMGTEHEYELTPNVNPQYAARIKFTSAKKTGGTGGFQKPANNASYALSYAKDVLVASWMSPDQSKRLTTKDMIALAQVNFEWLEARKA
jgi:hypothetical protein